MGQVGFKWLYGDGQAAPCMGRCMGPCLGGAWHGTWLMCGGGGGCK